MKFERFAFLASDAPEARRALQRLVKAHGNADPEKADVIVALGGDGLMLQTLHKSLAWKLPIYGMNRGSVGFMMNDYSEKDLPERLAAAELTTIRPLKMKATSINGSIHLGIAFNEVSLLRQRS